MTVDAGQIVDDLARHDPLLAVTWGMPVAELPSLDPGWWSERSRLWQVAVAADDPLLSQVAGREVAWMESGEFRRGVHATIDSPAFAVRQCLDEIPLRGVDDVELYVAVLRSVPTALAGLAETLREGIATGTVAARRQALATASAARRWDHRTFVERADPTLDGELPELVRVRLGEAASGAGAAFGGLASFLEVEYLPASQDDDPVGPDAYGVWAARYFAEPPPLDGHDWATEQLAELMPALRDARNLASAAGPSQRVRGAEAHRRWAQDFLDRAGPVMQDIVPLPPGATAPTVRLMPGELGSQATYYSPPKFDSDEPGVVWIEPSDGPHYVEYEKVVLAHEGIPGHHTETSHQRHAQGLTRFQRLAYLPAHSEGWGLYAEELGEESGLYDTPHSHAGYLGSLALRLASAAIDVGVHCRRRRADGSPWTNAAAIELLVEVGLDGPVAESWLQGILGRPGHRSTYAIGKRAWHQARRQAREAGLADREFHRRALALGPCPLSRLATDVLGRS